jgi:hypothetical protein
MTDDGIADDAFAKQGRPGKGQHRRGQSRPEYSPDYPSANRRAPARWLIFRHRACSSYSS